MAVFCALFRAMVIGLTGLIGAGKSEAARVLKSLGAVVVDADKIGHQVLRESVQLRTRLAKAFGREILDRNGRVLRKRLANARLCERKHKGVSEPAGPSVSAEGAAEAGCNCSQTGQDGG